MLHGGRYQLFPLKTLQSSATINIDSVEDYNEQ